LRTPGGGTLSRNCVAFAFNEHAIRFRFAVGSASISPSRDQPDLRFSGPWFNGSVVQRIRGSAHPWFSGPVV